jgi:uncharacterized protein (TIGR02217 family)
MAVTEKNVAAKAIRSPQWNETRRAIFLEALAASSNVAASERKAKMPRRGAPTDQRIGAGDGTAASFALVKRYGEGDEAQVRFIARPIGESVRVAVDGVERTVGWSLLPGGIVAFDIAPATGTTITAGFLFDVPVRFAEDSLEVSRSTFLAGEAPSVPLIEVRE